MNFSKEIKKNLSEINNLKDKEQVKYELIGYLLTENTSIIGKNKISYSTTNEYNINRFNKLLLNYHKEDFKISIKGKKYIIEFDKFEENVLKEINLDFENKMITINEKEFKNNIKKENYENDIKSLIRGVFMGSRNYK